MQRRDFISKLATAASWGSLAGIAPAALLAQDNFSDKLLFCLHCDPKTNQAGEAEISNWSRSSDIQTAGNLSYAPVANNSFMFDRYYQDMLVINGVDAQTNSHTVGVTNNWSGRNSDGYPSLTALYAASTAPSLPLAYLNFGGFGNTQSLIRSSRISNIAQLTNILFPNDYQYSAKQYHSNGDFERIRALQLRTAQRLAAQTNMPAGQRKNRQIFVEALTRVDGLGDFANSIPQASELQGSRVVTQNLTSSLHQQMQVSLLAMKSGVTVAVDLLEGGFDSHQDHDMIHAALLTNLNNAIDYFWTYAEQLGLADRIVLVMGSDFGRTPKYNSGAGKDHWPVGSYIIMERNAHFTNRVFGETDAGHSTYPVNLETGRQDYVNGVALHPKHIHLALRKYLGIQGNQYASSFPLDRTEDFAFFS
jgi:hypothetical protein